MNWWSKIGKGRSMSVTQICLPTTIYELQNLVIQWMRDCKVARSDAEMYRGRAEAAQAEVKAGANERQDLRQLVKEKSARIQEQAATIESLHTRIRTMERAQYPGPGIACNHPAPVKSYHVAITDETPGKLECNQYTVPADGASCWQGKGFSREITVRPCY